MRSGPTARSSIHQLFGVGIICHMVMPVSTTVKLVPLSRLGCISFICAWSENANLVGQASSVPSSQVRGSAACIGSASFLLSNSHSTHVHLSSTSLVSDTWTDSGKPGGHGGCQMLMYAWV